MIQLSLFTHRLVAGHFFSFMLMICFSLGMIFITLLL
uniref:Uncharacterized protein n=1 Tax=Arundo donax TaxID=35708 RepID=A0A0A9HVH3_ARUDO